MVPVICRLSHDKEIAGLNGRRPIGVVRQVFACDEAPTGLSVGDQRIDANLAPERHRGAYVTAGLGCQHANKTAAPQLINALAALHVKPHPGAAVFAARFHRCFRQMLLGDFQQCCAQIAGWRRVGDGISFGAGQFDPSIAVGQACRREAFCGLELANTFGGAVAIITIDACKKARQPHPFLYALGVQFGATIRANGGVMGEGGSQALLRYA